MEGWYVTIWDETLSSIERAEGPYSSLEMAKTKALEAHKATGEYTGIECRDAKGRLNRTKMLCCGSGVEIYPHLDSNGWSL